ncbi:MAG: hypothetical protein Q7T83_10800 [Thermodesulfovibrionales bacterium]|nr:hypothetical protein [Thermodesulfovibrionales bacterium]
MENWKDNIHFILVEPKEAGNIGASARAMKNMGFKNLELKKSVLKKAVNGQLQLKTVKMLFYLHFFTIMLTKE